MLADWASQIIADAEDAAARGAERARGIAFGVVTVASPLEVRFNDDDAAVKVGLTFDAYTPVVDDAVLLVRAGRDWICLGAFS